MKIAQMKKGIYSIPSLREFLIAANYRYLEFISALDDNSSGIKKLNKISKSVVLNNRTYKGFNLFSEDDHKLFESIVNGSFTISGFQNKTLRERITTKNTAQMSRIIKRLRVHEMIKKVRNTYKYYPTKLGQEVMLTGLKLKELFIIPNLSPTN